MAAKIALLPLPAEPDEAHSLFCVFSRMWLHSTGYGITSKIMWSVLRTCETLSIPLKEKKKQIGLESVVFLDFHALRLLVPLLVLPCQT